MRHGITAMTQTAIPRLGSQARQRQNSRRGDATSQQQMRARSEDGAVPLLTAASCRAGRTCGRRSCQAGTRATRNQASHLCSRQVLCCSRSRGIRTRASRRRSTRRQARCRAPTSACTDNALRRAWRTPAPRLGSNLAREERAPLSPAIM